MLAIVFRAFSVILIVAGAYAGWLRDYDLSTGFFAMAILMELWAQRQEWIGHD